ncbi:hypothetical protein OUZ56_000915 [Daphnia magna]|uniref:Uncharacterized protein n=1 Tax=Daphnia magna TaxID=35525 RepID=A0ABR0A146_9CRUS|nr:hypothetical protein OUZ56_000915 [Daphnia magna]
MQAERGSIINLQSYHGRSGRTRRHTLAFVAASCTVYGRYPLVCWYSPCEASIDLYTKGRNEMTAQLLRSKNGVLSVDWRKDRTQQGWLNTILFLPNLGLRVIETSYKSQAAISRKFEQDVPSLTRWVDSPPAVRR